MCENIMMAPGDYLLREADVFAGYAADMRRRAEELRREACTMDVEAAKHERAAQEFRGAAARIEPIAAT